MMDDRDYFQRRAESSVRLSRTVRAVLAILVFIAAIVLIFLAGLVLTANRTKMPHPDGAIYFAVFTAALGLGIAYIGIRLLRAKSPSDHLLGPLGARITSYCIAIIGIVTVVASFFAKNLYFTASGLFAVLMAYWLHTSAKRIGG